jgi:hypothetical protein
MKYTAHEHLHLRPTSAAAAPAEARKEERSYLVLVGKETVACCDCSSTELFSVGTFFL